MKLKRGVRVRGVRPETVLAMMIAESILSERHIEFTITSCTEGKHSRGSLHYSGGAFDMRSRDMSSQLQKIRIVDDLKEALGIDFDVVLEKTHIHVEFQPKGE